MLEKIKNLFAEHHKNLHDHLKKSSKQQTVSIYAIFKEEPELSPDGTLANKKIRPITFVSDLSQAAIVLDRLLYYKHFDHFSSWLQYSKKYTDKTPSIKSEAWVDYMATVLADVADTEFYVPKLTYTLDQFTSMLRRISFCDPIYVSHENPVELFDYVHRNCDEGGKFILPNNIAKIMEIDDTIKESVSKAYLDLDDYIAEELTKQKKQEEEVNNTIK